MAAIMISILLDYYTRVLSITKAKVQNGKWNRQCKIRNETSMKIISTKRMMLIYYKSVSVCIIRTPLIKVQPFIPTILHRWNDLHAGQKGPDCPKYPPLPPLNKTLKHVELIFSLMIKTTSWNTINCIDDSCCFSFVWGWLLICYNACNIW